MTEIPTDQPPVFRRLVALLTDGAADFTVLHHRPVFTSEEAAAVRGTPLASGAKALLLKVDDRFVMGVLPADRKLDSRSLRSVTGARSTRFATADEVIALTQLRPGSIPPFGSLFGIPCLCDPALSNHERINFNAGDHAISISLRFADYVRIESPTSAVLSKASE